MWLEEGVSLRMTYFIDIYTYNGWTFLKPDKARNPPS